MQFAFEYNDKDCDVGRVSKLYYHFVLYEEEKPVGGAIAGLINNVLRAIQNYM
jgi:hypothetical protein